MVTSDHSSVRRPVVLPVALLTWDSRRVRPVGERRVRPRYVGFRVPLWLSEVWCRYHTVVSTGVLLVTGQESPGSFDSLMSTYMCTHVCANYDYVYPYVCVCAIMTTCARTCACVSIGGDVCPYVCVCVPIGGGVRVCVSIDDDVCVCVPIDGDVCECVFVSQLVTACTRECPN